MLTKNKCQQITLKKMQEEAIKIAHLLQRKPGTNSATKGHGLIVFETGLKFTSLLDTSMHSTMTKNKFLQCI